MYTFGPCWKYDKNRFSMVPPKKKKNNFIFKPRNHVFATNSDFLIPITILHKLSDIFRKEKNNISIWK